MSGRRARRAAGNKQQQQQQQQKAQVKQTPQQPKEASQSRSDAPQERKDAKKGQRNDDDSDEDDSDDDDDEEMSQFPQEPSVATNTSSNRSFRKSTSDSERPYVLCVSTWKYPPALSGTGASSSAHVIQFVCPYTGAVLTNSSSGQDHARNDEAWSTGQGGSASRALHPLQVSPGVGIYTLRCSTMGDRHAPWWVYWGYGGRSSSGSKEDVYAMLWTRSHTSSSSSGPKWTCRLPEPLGRRVGLVPSPCGRYILGTSSGSGSQQEAGRCYCWSTHRATSGGSDLLRVWEAHYRPITALLFLDPVCFVTGARDGMVHVWNLLTVVDPSSPGTTIRPCGTWNFHSLAITDMTVLSSFRFVTAGLDRFVLILEWGGRGECRVVGRLCMPTVVQVLTVSGAADRLFGGAVDGTIYCVDLHAHAISQTAAGAATVLPKTNPVALGAWQGTTTTTSGVSELRGHARAVTCLVEIPADNNTTTSAPLLVSGSDDGSLRIWDLAARCCIRVLHPWAASTTVGALPQEACPCSSILVLPRQGTNRQTSPHTGGGNRWRQESEEGSVVHWLRPLQRFPCQQESLLQVAISTPCQGVDLSSWLDKDMGLEEEQDDDDDELARRIVQRYRQGVAPFSSKTRMAGAENQRSDHPHKKPRREETMQLDDDDRSENEEEEDYGGGDQAAQEIQRLKQELATAHDTIARWETVSTKLTQKLQLQKGRQT